MNLRVPGAHLCIPLAIWQRLRMYVELSAPHEVTGIGTLMLLDAENFYVKEVFLPRQTASQVDCEFQEGELNEIIYELMQGNPSRVEQLRFRWHSHGYSQVFWSQKDEQDIAAWESPWVVNLVMNAQNERLARLDLFSPLRIRNYPLKVEIVIPEDAKLHNECAEELERKVAFQEAAMRSLGKEPGNGLFGSAKNF